MTKYLQWFKRDGESALKGLIGTDIASKTILKKYEKLTPIEDLPILEKHELWKEANRLFPLKDKEFKMKACRIIYTIGSMI